MVAASPDQGSMPVPQVENRKNYIGVVSDATEDERLAASALRSQAHVLSYLVDRLTAAFRRRPNGALGPPAP